MFWHRLATFVGTIRTHILVEMERNPMAVRQGAAAVACIAAAAVAMPVISHRAAEQRDGAEWAARSDAFQTQLQAQLIQGAEPNARIELVSMRTVDGLRARGQAPLLDGAADSHAMLVQAALRGPLSLNGEAAPVEREQLNPREQRCLSEAIYYEARGETHQGQVAVAEVIMNRVRSKHYPNSICGVVYQGSHRATGCQFTFTCDGSLGHRPRGRAWERAQQVATQVMEGFTRPVTQRATHYHTTAVNPVWSSGLVQTTQIGVHVFYRFPNRSEQATYREALARRRGTLPRAINPAEAEEAEAIEEVVAAEGVEAVDVETVSTGAAPADDAPVTTSREVAT